MKFIALLFADRELAHIPAPGTDEFSTLLEDWSKFNTMLADGGHLVEGATAVDETTVLRKSADMKVTESTPPADELPWLGGYYVIEADDVQAASALMQQAPTSPGDTFIRPMMFPVTAGSVDDNGGDWS
ncbi:MAG: hypothetical protein ACR2QO_10335 [Acidimicrobiales bacterium]